MYDEWNHKKYDIYRNKIIKSKILRWWIWQREREYGMKPSIANILPKAEVSATEYNLWIQIQDFPFKRGDSRVKGRISGRIHHLMSNLELWYFYLLDWSKNNRHS